MLTVACFGAGYFSQFHFDGWQRMDWVSVVGVANRDTAKAAATGFPVFASVDEMLARTDPDILDIIVSPAGHAEAIRAAVAHGVRAIICQKPFCLSLSEAEEMTDLAGAAGIPLIVHENFRFQPWFRAIKAALEAGKIGTPMQATFRLRPGDGQGDDAYLARQPYFRKMPRFLIHETGVHYVDTFRYLFGNPVAVYADLRRINPAIAGEDAGFVLFDHAHGVRCMLDGNRCLDHAADNTRCTMGEGLIEGTEGTLILSGDGAVRLRKFGALSTSEILAPDATGTFGGDCTFALQKHVVEALEGHGAFENLAADYLFVLGIEDAIYRSSQNGTKIELTT